MTSKELLIEIESWLSFNTEPSREETAKLRKSIKDHLTKLNVIKPRQQHLPQTNISGQVCGCCKKQLTAGAFPKWFCLRNDCKMYLKPQTLY